MRRARLLTLLMLIAWFAPPSLADEPSAAQPPVGPGAGFEQSLERLQDQINRKLGKLTQHKLEELEAQEDERQTMHPDWSYAMERVARSR